MKRSYINKESKKRRAEKDRWFALEHDLREMGDNKSELSGWLPSWENDYYVEYHHIRGRSGKRIYDPFNVIALTSEEHRDIEEERNKTSKEELEDIVRPIRISQGFKEGE